MTAPAAAPAASDRAELDWMVAVVRRADPRLDEVTVRAVIAESAPTAWTRGRLAAELASSPEVLTSGRPARRPVTRRLVDGLAAAGSRTVRRPSCRLCRRVRDLPMALDGGGRACAACRDLLLAEPCPGCGSWRRLYRQPGGSRACPACSAHRPRRPVSGPAERCPGCGMSRRLSRARVDGTRICRPCDQRELAEWLREWRAWFRRPPQRHRLRGTPQVNQHTRTQWVVEAVSAADPGLTEDAVRAALARVAPTPAALSVIARELLWWPQQLLTGRADMTMPVQRLVADLVAAGSTGLRRPACTSCRRVQDLLPTPLAGGGRICDACKRHLNAERCPGCDRWRPLTYRQTDGVAVCSVCARRDPGRWEQCLRCGRRRAVVRRTADGPYCGPCRPEPDLPCAGCGRRDVTRRRCAGRMLCRRCAVAPARICGFCRLTRLRTDPDPGCPRCGTTEPLRCGACGDVTFAFGGSVRSCYRCRLNRRLARLVDGGDPDRVARLGPFLRGLQHVEDPRRGLDWLYRGRTAQRLLDDLLHGRAAVGHVTLDAVNACRAKRSTSVEHLRYLLVASGVLPPRDEPLHRLEEHIDRLLRGADPASQAVLRQWALWFVLPRVRRRIAAGHPSRGVALAGKASVTTVHHFLGWLHRRDTTLGGLTQTLLDEWTADHLDQTAEVGTFLRWARRHRHAPRRVRPPQPGPSTIGRLATGQDELYAAARRCLTDTDIPAGHRLAAALVLLYGQPLSRVCRLRVDDLQPGRDGTVALRLGRVPLTLPPPLADIAQAAAADAVRDAVRTGVGTGFTHGPGWLFPGLPLSKHADPSTLAERVGALLPGNIRGHRNTALLTLARDVPPVVLADLLGLHPNTAERWRTLAGGGPATYTAARVAAGASTARSPTPAP